MSKAFMRENNSDESDLTSPMQQLPGVRNYITPAGYRRLTEELEHLWKVERPALVQTIAWAASNGDRSENGDYIYGKRRLREIDRRIRFLRKRIESAEVVDPAQRKDGGQVFFGATVTVCDAEGCESTYSIVGIDEADVAAGRISWISPLARALLKLRQGEVAIFRTPTGVSELEVVSVTYCEID